MNKKVLLSIVVFGIITIIGIKVVWDLSDKGFAHYGGAWQDSPERALLQEADNTIDSEQTLTIAHLLDTRDIEDITIMTFVSRGDTLVTVTFIKNEKGQYSVYGYTEEPCLTSPSMFLLNGDPEQLNFDSKEFILFPYNQRKTTVWGWSCTNRSFTVNGITPSKETYVFDCQGKTWSIDFWSIEGVTSEADVQIEYVD